MGVANVVATKWEMKKAELARRIDPAMVILVWRRLIPKCPPKPTLHDVTWMFGLLISVKTEILLL